MPFQENVSELCTVGHTDGVLLAFFFLSFYRNMFFIVVRSLAFYCFISSFYFVLFCRFLL